VNQILEDMLCACILSYGAKWEDCLPFAEFSYNNSYQASLQMAPLKPYMVVNAEPLSTSRKLEKAKCLALISSKKPKSKCS
jgi:hypothetical protein